jgi:hypothetical protein
MAENLLNVADIRSILVHPKHMNRTTLCDSCGRNVLSCDIGLVIPAERLAMPTEAPIRHGTYYVDLYENNRPSTSLAASFDQTSTSS